MRGPPGIKSVYINTSWRLVNQSQGLPVRPGGARTGNLTDRAQALKAFIRAPTGNHTEVGPSLKRGKALPSYDDPQTDIIIVEVGPSLKRMKTLASYDK